MCTPGFQINIYTFSSMLMQPYPFVKINNKTWPIYSALYMLYQLLYKLYCRELTLWFQWYNLSNIQSENLRSCSIVSSCMYLSEVMWRTVWEWVTGLHKLIALHQNSETYWKIEKPDLGSRIRPLSLLMSRKSSPFESKFIHSEDIIHAFENISPF